MILTCYRGTDRLEDALSDGAKQRRENSPIVQFVDESFGFFDNDVPQSPVDPARQNLLLNACEPQQAKTAPTKTTDA